MHKTPKWIKSLVAFGSVVVGSYYCGIYTERQRCNLSHSPNTLHKSEEICLGTLLNQKNGLHLLERVEAAVPALPSDNNTNVPTAQRVGQIMVHGFPSLDNVRSYSDYVLSYDRRNRVPNWVLEHLTAESVAKNDEVDRALCNFRPDESVHPYFRSQNTDYLRSGFDRGHMAAAGNHRLHQKHCEDTFFLTNMAPQIGKGFNRDSWNRLEIHVRKLTKIYNNVYVCTGPLYLPKKDDDGKKYVKYQVIGDNNVAVPTHFYKVVLGQTSSGLFEMEAYVMPNAVIDDTTPLSVFQVPLESIERAAGLLLFDRLDKKKIIRVNGKSSKSYF